MRPRHQRKEFEALLKLAEAHGFDVTKGSRYYKCKCPCGDHLLSVSLTPSSSRTLKNKQMEFKRLSCWKEEEQ